MTARASIVVTNYNYERHVAAAVSSALEQPDTEVVVVDDGSTDRSLEVLADFGDRITLVAQPNGGQAAAFNVGFAATTAPVIVFLDADDVLASDLVGRVVDVFEERPGVGRVQFPLDLIDDAGRALGGTMPTDPHRLARGDVRDRLVRFPSDLLWQPTSGNAFRRSVLAEILPMPEAQFRICADYYVSNLSAAHGEIAVLPASGGGYRVHGKNSHFSVAWSLDAVRANIVRTSATHAELIEHCDRIGLHGLPDHPDEVASVTALAHRMVSCRRDPEHHPITGDSRVRLALDGVRAAFGRFDCSWPRRATMASWFMVAALVPSRMIRWVARPVVPLAAEMPN